MLVERAGGRSVCGLKNTLGVLILFNVYIVSFECVQSLFLLCLQYFVCDLIISTCKICACRSGILSFITKVWVCFGGRGGSGDWFSLPLP